MPCYPWQAASLTHILTSLDGSISQTAEQPVTSADEAPAHVPQGHFQPWSWAYLPEKVGFLYVRHGSGECHRSVKIRAIPSDHFTEPWKIVHLQMIYDLAWKTEVFHNHVKYCEITKGYQHQRENHRVPWRNHRMGTGSGFFIQLFIRSSPCSTCRHYKSTTFADYPLVN